MFHAMYRNTDLKSKELLIFMFGELVICSNIVPSWTLQFAKTASHLYATRRVAEVASHSDKVCGR